MTLRQLRGSKGFTQKWVSEKVEVTQTTVSYWERGCGKPCRKYRKKLAELYGVTPWEIEDVIDETMGRR